MKKRKTRLFSMMLLATVMLAAAGCSKPDDNGSGNGSIPTSQTNKPTVETSSVREITDTDAKGGGVVTDDGGSDITERGLCWSANPDPSVSNDHAMAGEGTGTFTCAIINLTPATTYYVRAYAINKKGVGYGNVVSFVTDAETNKPKVETSIPSNVTESSATTGGIIINDGGSEIFERGVCYGTNPAPGVSEAHVTSGTGVGSFTCTITDLDESTTYYVRAYAINSNGIGYGPEISFTTHGRPIVTTGTVTNIDFTSAVCGGTVVDECGAPIEERGVCWSTYQNPSVYDNVAWSVDGLSEFTVSMAHLTPNTTYYVRAFAYNDSGVGYGEEKIFTTLAPPVGSIGGKFSVSASKKVWFSKGNLQYKAYSGTWQFAANQYDYIGDANGNISSSYSGWIDLFGWGSSGWNCGSVYYRPYDVGNYVPPLESFGPPSDLTDSYAHSDWGVHNAISNGGNTAGLWRTLTIDEWEYVFNTRSTSSGVRYAKAQVAGVNGVILLPDDWSTSCYSLSNVNNGGASYSSNVIGSSNWISNLQAHGAVFLPAAGDRFMGQVDDVGSYGRYWSASSASSTGAFCLHFYTILDFRSANRFYGHSVRLVCPAE